MSDYQTEWAQVEIFGHRQHWGRIFEVERFGAKMLRIDIPTDDPEVFEAVFYGGSSIFSLTPCTEEVCRAWAARQYYRRTQALISRLPPSIAEDFPYRDEDLDDDERQAIAAASQHPPNHPPHLVDESRHPFAAEATDETDGLASHG